MSLLNVIKADQLQARKDRNAIVASSLTTLIGDLERKQKDQGSISDAEVIAIVKKHLQGVIDNIALSMSEEKAAPFNTEAAVLSKYLPTQIEGDRLRNIIVGIIGTLSSGVSRGASQGDVMKTLKAEFGGQYDGREASVIVKEELSK